VAQGESFYYVNDSDIELVHRYFGHITTKWDKAQPRADADLMPYSQIAAQLGISRQAVHQALTAALIKLRAAACLALDRELRGPGDIVDAFVERPRPDEVRAGWKARKLRS
jgi:hypothetical protein